MCFMFVNSSLCPNICLHPDWLTYKYSKTKECARKVSEYVFDRNLGKDRYLNKARAAPFELSFNHFSYFEPWTFLSSNLTVERYKT